MKFTPILMLVLHLKLGVFFLDISKAFDRVWLDGLLYKLKLYGINGPLLHLLKSFLTNRFQRVVLNMVKPQIGKKY